MPDSFHLDAVPIRLERCGKTFAGGARALEPLDLTIHGGETVVFLGPSGCGKTTTLRMIAGLESVSGGTVRIDGRDATAIPARQRNIGMVFQSYALFPHLTIFENVAYGLRIRKLAEAGIRKAVGECLDLLALAPLAERLPGQLSGGQQQRVSIARALVYRPPVLLLDEPLANLDAKLRVQMRDEIRRVQRTLGIMVLYVTHDQEEAMAISDRIAVFDRGRVAQIGAPDAVYDRPESLFVADFIGKANFIKVEMEAAGTPRLRLPSGDAAVPERVVALPAHERDTLGGDGSKGLLMVRPERLMPADSGPIRGRVDRIQNLGPLSRGFVVADGMDAELIVDLPRSAPRQLAEGETCHFDFRADDATLFRRTP